jgi:hypothetical protein
MVGGVKRRKGALGGERDGVADVSRLIEGVQPQRVVTKDPVEVLGEREIRPVIIDTDELDAVAPIRCRRSRDLISCTVALPVSWRSASNRAGGNAVETWGALFQPRSAVMKPAMSATAVRG